MTRIVTEDLLKSSNHDPVARGEEVPLLDETGHLTSAAAAFPDELGVYQQAVVERHLAACPLCAQQAAALAGARRELLVARPMTIIPTGLDIVGQQIARRVIPLAEQAAAKKRQAESAAAPRRPWWRPPPTVLLAMLIGMAAALLVAVAGLLLAGCKGKEEQPGPLEVTLGAAVEQTRVRGEVSAARLSADGKTLAVGLKDGGIMLLPLGGDLAPAPPEASLRMAAPISALAHAAGDRRLLVAAGKTVALWDMAAGKQVKDVTGPQAITTLIVGPAGKVAYFGTDQGHVLRWDLAQRTAEAMAGFACGATGVPTARLQLPPKKRCKFGVYFKSSDGQHACLYPVSSLLVHNGRMFRACREGTLAGRELSGEKSAWFRAGHLSVMATMPPGELLLGRVEGQLNVYSVADNKLLRTLQAPAARPLAAAATADLLAVVQGSEVRIWARPGKHPAARAQVPPGVVWLQLSGDTLRYLARDGRLIRHPLTTRERGSK